jgi:hypothetical protein
VEREQWGHYEVTVMGVQPHAARKPYACPGCESVIAPGTYHLVVVPDEEPDLRRHWHRGCWLRQVRMNRRPRG